LFDFTLYALLVFASIPGILITVPNQARRLAEVIAQRNSEPRSTSTNHFVIANLTQSVLFVLVTAAVGTALAHRAGLEAPVFVSLTSNSPLWPALHPQLVPAMLGGTLGALVHILLYYAVFRPRLDEQTRSISERLLLQMGIVARVLFGGIFEEILFRWGIMSLLAWLGFKLIGVVTPLIIWSAILLSGLLFGLSHIPGALAIGAKKTPVLWTSALVMNLWGSIVFGWLFWQYGLFSAMMGHALFHLIWLPFQRYYSKKTSGF
jgi:membrane protease YdiL (CAAX protease family)